MKINLLKIKKYSLIGLASAVLFLAGYGASRTTEAELIACSKDSFVSAVFETAQYAQVFTKAQLAEQLDQAGLPPAETERYSKALDYVFDKGYGNPLYAALADCLNK